VATRRPTSGADASHTITLNVSVGVIRMKNGFGMTAVGTPSSSSDPTVASAATNQNRPSSVDRSAAALPGTSTSVADG